MNMKIHHSKKRNRQLNHGGFSLVELLVSITILAIIVVPLLNSFVTAARTNAKAKRVMEATTSGQNLMEQIKSMSGPELVEEYFQDSMTTDDINYISASNVSATSGRSYYAVTTATKGSPYNSVNVSQIPNMDSGVSGYLIMGTEDSTAEINMRPDPPYDPDNPDIVDDTSWLTAYHNSIKRNIEIIIERNGGNYSVKSDIVYTSDGGTDRQTYELYSGDSLENIFVCFTPLSSIEGGDYSNEQITIHNLANAIVNVYLVEQTDVRYPLSVVINEGEKVSGETSVIPTACSIYTNASTVSTSLNLKDGSGNIISPPVGSMVSPTVITQLVEQKPSTFIYDFKIEVYPDEESYKAGEEPLAELTGTKTK